MKYRFHTRRLFRASLLFAFFLPALAHGQSAAALPLDIDPALESFDKDALRAELDRQLELSKVAPDASKSLGTLLVRGQGQHPVLVFVTSDGRTITRKLELPEDRALATTTLAFAASNLVRDEAGEILAKLTPAPAPSPEPTPSPSPSPPPPPFSCQGTRPIPVGIDFAPFIGTSSAAPDATRGFSFNFVGGYAEGLDGFEIGVGANIESKFACGVQIAAGANIVGGPVRGLQLATVNIAGPVRGSQIGVVDISSGDVSGSQIGVVSIAAGSMKGAQIGVVGVSGGDVRGSQISVANVAGGRVDGAQIGVANVTGGGIDGVQIGVANTAAGDVDGLQIGVANIASGKVRDTQIGVFNYADENDAPIGLVNVVRNGRTSLEAWGTADGTASIGVRHGGRVVHNVVGVGVPFAAEGSSWGFTLGLGARVPIADKIHLDIDLLTTTLANRKGNPFSEYAPHNYRLAFEVGYELADRFGVFGGPSVDVLLSHRDTEITSPPWGSISLHEGKERVHITPGLTLGVRYDVQRTR